MAGKILTDVLTLEDVGLVGFTEETGEQVRLNPLSNPPRMGAFYGLASNDALEAFRKVVLSQMKDGDYVYQSKQIGGAVVRVIPFVVYTRRN